MIFIYCVYLQMPTIDESWGKLGDKQFDSICVDMTRFIQREISHGEEEFFNKEGVLIVNECEKLHSWV
jgi:hypothetical protein